MPKVFCFEKWKWCRLSKEALARTLAKHIKSNEKTNKRDDLK